MMADLQKFKELEDERVHYFFEKHNEWLAKVNEIDSETAGTVMLAQKEECYAWARLYASLIAGTYRTLQRRHEARAEIGQADAYETARLHNEKLNGSTDAQYLSRKAKGEELLLAADHEGNCMRWMGISAAYENSINAIKDMIKGLEKEKGGGV